ncbi:GNAT family N-acetyltransferase [Solirhodobacter olei]|uniref:GNAT family N-acetyltransferase n=1 Tax=Solirhodobacter olei TaxID=2493082 RepID=UPI0019D4A5D8|nr:N-acetyltransferase [Solirhodobacter olei]
MTKVAFAPVEWSDGSEPQIVDRLRLNGNLTVSLVAVEDDQIVGHVAFSPVTVSDADGRWFGLGPISVHPDLQRVGIGRLLIEEGLERLRSLGCAGCIVLGDPAYYGRFGFSSPGDLTYGDAPTRYLQALSFEDKRASGNVQYSSAFER